jgi:hypothetical protein
MKRPKTVAEQLRGRVPTNGRPHEPPPWESPIPFGSAVPVPPFPLASLPGPLADFVDCVSAALACPADFVAVPLLAIAGGAVGASRALELHPGWTERPSVYAAIIGRPGSAKSPALKAVASPVYSRQNRLKADYDAATEQYEQDLAAYTAEMKRRGGAVTRGGRAIRVHDPENDSPLEDPPEKPKKPSLQRVYASDTTVEALAPALLANPRGLTIIRDELTAWVAAMNQYKGGRGSDRQFYLAAWAGEPVCVDRKGQAGVPIIVAHPFLCIVGCLPPDTVGSLREHQYVADGFLDRILFAYPDALPVAGYSDACVTEEQSAVWLETLDYLTGLNMAAHEGGCRPYFVRLTHDGREEWRDFVNAHAAEMNAEGFPDALAGPWSKMKGYCARLSLIVQLLWAAQRDGTEENVDAQSVRGAVRLVNYFKAHAAKVYRELDVSHQVRDAGKVLRWLRRERLATFSKRDAHNALQGTFKTVDDLEPVLGLLTRHHYIRPAPQPEREGSGRRPSPVYEVNPSARSTESTQSTESPAGEPVL